jgi:hypothetical protein
MTEIKTVTEAVTKAREKLVEMNGMMGVIMLQIESANLITYAKNEEKPTWKVVCSFYTNMSGTERVRREVYIDQATGDTIDYNGFSS